jgi:hypothetical protein
VRRRRARWPSGIAAALVSALLTAGCGPQATQQMFDVPNCRVDTNGTLVLMAQAVPTASHLPCIRTLPEGWSFGGVDVKSGLAQFWLDSDRAGPGALKVLLTASCRPSGTQIPSDQLGSSLYLKIRNLGKRYVADRIYLLPSGCITYRFDFPNEGKALLTTDAITAIEQLPRQQLEQFVHGKGYTL